MNVGTLLSCIFILLINNFSPPFAVGYKITVGDRTLIGVNQKFIVKELGKKKREYLDNEKLAQIAKLYESNKVSNN